MQQLKFALTVSLMIVTVLFYLIIFHGNKLIIHEDIIFVPLLNQNDIAINNRLHQRLAKICTKLDGHNEWRQYQFWLNKKLALLPNTDLSTTLQQLNNSKLLQTMPVQTTMQNLENYTFYVNHMDYQYENRKHYIIYITENLNGKYNSWIYAHIKSI